MFRVLVTAAFLLSPLLAQDGLPDIEVLLGQGIAQFQSKHYPEAIAVFQKVLEVNPAAAHWYLAQIYLAQYVPGDRGTGNVVFAERARTEFERLLDLNSQNTNIMASLGCLSYQEAQGIDNLQDKDTKMDEARTWYQRWLSVDAESHKANYAIGVVDSQKLYYALMAARSKIGMKPDVLSPLTDAAIRQELGKKYNSVIDDGIAHLARAMEVDPEDSAAMSYMSLLIRERADLRDTQDEYNEDVAASAAWAQKVRHGGKSAASATQESPSGLPAMTAPVPPSCGRSGRH